MSATALDMLECTNCKSIYHYQCLGINESDFNDLKSHGRVLTKCLTCKNTRKGDNLNTPVRDSLAVLTTPTPLATCTPATPTMNTPTNTVAAVKNLEFEPVDQPKFVQEITALLTLEIRKEIRDNFTSLNNDMTEKINSLTSTVESISKDFCEYKQKVLDIEKQSKHFLSFEEKTLTELDDHKQKLSEVDYKTKRIADLEDKLSSCLNNTMEIQLELDKQQQWSRLNNIEIVGVPETKNESPMSIVRQIFVHVGVQLAEYDVEFAHRVRSAQREAASAGRPRVIIARLRNRDLKGSVISAMRKCRGIKSSDIGILGEPRQIYVNEHLTQKNKKLFKSCKEKCDAAGYKYAWVRNCTIYCRKTDTDNHLQINSFLDLQKIF